MTVIGRPELVDEAIDHLLNLEEEYVSFCTCKNIQLFCSDAEGCSLTPLSVMCFVRWLMLLRMRQRWLTGDLLLPLWMNIVVHPKVLW